jgi:hypothetical protein
VSSTDGDIELRIHGESWAHTVLPVGAVAEAPVGVERVESMSMGRVLELARELGNGRLVVKLDIEGAECDVVQGPRPRHWNTVYELLVEHHAFAPCTVDTLARHLSGAALPLHDVRVGDVLHFKRARRGRSLTTHGGTR